MASIEVAVIEIEDDAPANEKAVARARFILNAVFAAYGDPARKPGAQTLAGSEVEAALTMALGMVQASDKGLSTPADFRKAADHVAKDLRKFSMFWRENLSDEQRAAMGLTSTRLN